jgi:undecaprenyl-diphosphatase
MDFSLFIQAIILGVVQGLTEFLPVSSSAHLILVPWLFGWEDDLINSLPFDLALHLGTLVSVLAFFAGDWVRLIRAGLASLAERRIGADTDRRLAWLIVVASVPGAVIGALVESRVEAFFHAPGEPLSTSATLLMAGLLALLGLLLFIAERIARHVRALASLNLRDAVLIGLAQAAAVIPGVSRSGATITAALFLNFRRDDAARFSFLLSAPIIAGAGLKNIYDVVQESGGLSSSDLFLYLVGFVAAALSGFFAIRFLLRYLQRNSTNIFVYYRWALALFIVVITLLRP